MANERPKTVVFGLDGAHFELIDRWIAKGELPNIERAIESGVKGDLQSVLPPVTSPNWKSYATGKNPGKFGIFWWENIDTKNHRVYYPHDRKHTELEYWELLSKAGQTGVLNVPTTYPPKKTGEFIVAGPPDGKDSGYAYPEQLEHRLEAEYNYKVTLENMVTVSPDEAAEEILKLINKRFSVAQDLFDERDLSFLQVTTFYLNTLHHYFWDHEYTRRGWEIIDEYLGDFLDEGHDIILMSDHGATEIDTIFHVNSWLEQNDYLELDADTAKLMYRLGINRSRLLRVLSLAGLTQFATYAPQFFRNLVPTEQGELPRQSKTSNLDWEASDALASGQGPVYLLLNHGTEQYEETKHELIGELEGLEQPDGRPLFNGVYDGGEVYTGRFEIEAPDIVLDQVPGVHIQGNLGREEVFSKPSREHWVAENKRNGLFVATGPSFDTGSVESLSILDLAPTMLHLNGQAVPTDMDGDVRLDVFHPSSLPANEEPVYRKKSDQNRERDRVQRIVRQTILN